MVLASEQANIICPVAIISQIRLVRLYYLYSCYLDAVEQMQMSYLVINYNKLYIQLYYRAVQPFSCPHLQNKYYIARI